MSFSALSRLTGLLNQLVLVSLLCGSPVLLSETLVFCSCTVGDGDNQIFKPLWNKV